MREKQKNFRPQKILTFGAGGFIGAHLTQRLLFDGHTVVGVDTHSDKIEEFLDHERFIYIEQDVCQDSFDLEGILNDVDLVIDLIAYANPQIYIKFPLDVFRLNFTENLKIAEACVHYDKRLIQFSTCEVYGKTVAKMMPHMLKDPQDPALATFSEDSTNLILGPVGKHRWIYACAKQLLERVLHAYGLEDKLDYTIIRPFNFIGPKIDYFPSEISHMPRVFSFFMEALIEGTEMKLVDGGSQRRCYTYIDDAIECISRIIENPENVCNREIFNIGSPNNEISIKELAELMRSIYAERYKKPDVALPKIVDISAEEFYGEGYEDSDRRIPDIVKVRSLLGWEPKFLVAEMMERTMEYYMSDYKRDTSNNKKDSIGP